MEGLEYLLEAYFGPAGYFKNSEKSYDSVSPSDPRPAKLSSNKLDAVHKQVRFTCELGSNSLIMPIFHLNNS